MRELSVLDLPALGLPTRPIKGSRGILGNRPGLISHAQAAISRADAACACNSRPYRVRVLRASRRGPPSQNLERCAPPRLAAEFLAGQKIGLWDPL